MRKPNAKMRRRLEQIKKMTTQATAAAMEAASKSIDQLIQENTALRRILISERAQVIYYTDKYLAFVKHECLDLVAQGFLELEESLQEPYVKRAIKELNEGFVPHDQVQCTCGAGNQASTHEATCDLAQPIQPETPTIAKKLILPN